MNYPDIEPEDSEEELFPDEDVVQPVDPSQMLLGTTFSDKKSFKKHLRHFCVLNEHEYKIEKSDKSRLRVWCPNRVECNCMWFVFASKVGKESTFKVRGVDLTHTCEGNIEGRNRAADASFVASVVLDKLSHTDKKVIPKPRQIQGDFKASHLTKIPYHTAWKARNLVLEGIYGNYEESFKMVPTFCKMVSDKGNLANFTFCKTDNAFESMTISFAAAIKGWQEGCRSVIGLDACHLNGKYGGVLLAATGLEWTSHAGIHGLQVRNH